MLGRIQNLPAKRVRQPRERPIISSARHEQGRWSARRWASGNAPGYAVAVHWAEVVMLRVS